MADSSKVEPLKGYDNSLTLETLQSRSQGYLAICKRRRSVRSFSKQAVDRAVIENCIRTAGTAPSGANQQPWHFVAVGDPKVKRELRIAAEKEEYEFYNRRAPQEWLDALSPIGTDEYKPFLETAPWLIAIFAETYGTVEDAKKKHYYVSESVGIATGLLISALNYCGLATLTHTPSPMKFLNEILGRPSNERPFLLLVVGFPSEECTVPLLKKKSLEELATFKD